MDLYYKARKSILQMEEVAHSAKAKVISLDDKIKMSRLENKLGKINRSLLLLYFDFEDANNATRP